MRVMTICLTTLVIAAGAHLAGATVPDSSADAIRITEHTKANDAVFKRLFRNLRQMGAEISGMGVRQSRDSESMSTAIVSLSRQNSEIRGNLDRISADVADQELRAKQSIQALSHRMTVGMVAGGSLVVLMGIFLVTTMTAQHRQFRLLRMDLRAIASVNTPPDVVAAIDSPAADHTLPCAVAREVFRMRGRLNASPPGIDGVKQALGRIDDELTSRGYATRDLTGIRYHEGMRVQVVNFVPSEAVVPGHDMVIRTLRPEISHKGAVIDPGAVEVAVSHVPEMQSVAA